jgi:hypothetical protein
VSAARRESPPALGLFRADVQVSAWRLFWLLLAGTAFAALDLRAGLGPHDEGLMLQWGHRIAGGEWPYRDFWCNYLPGQPLLQAVIGDSLWAWRWVRAVTGAVAAVLAYLVVRRETTDDRWALAAWAGVAAAMAWPLTPGPNASATALAFGALLAARGHGVRAGVLAGLAFLFRPEIGVAAAIGAIVLGRGRRAWWITPASAAAVGFAGLLPFLAVAPGDFLSQTIGFVGIQHLQHLPFPLAPHTTDPNKLLERLFPAILVAATALWAATALPRGRGGALVALILAGLAYLLARTDEFHLVPLSAVLAVALAAAASREAVRPLQIALAAGLALIVLHGIDRQYGKVQDAGDMVAVELATGPTVRTQPGDAHGLEDLAAAVAHRSRPGDYLLSAPPRYDRVRVGDTLLYVLLDRRNPTRYDVDQPGVVTKASVQREMRRDLVRSGTRLIVRWEAPIAREPEPNGSGHSSHVHLLDRWIGEHFRRVGRYGDYVLLERR